MLLFRGITVSVVEWSVQSSYGLSTWNYIPSQKKAGPNRNAWVNTEVKVQRTIKSRSGTLATGLAPNQQRANRNTKKTRGSTLTGLLQFPIFTTAPCTTTTNNNLRDGVSESLLKMVTQRRGLCSDSLPPPNPGMVCLLKMTERRGLCSDSLLLYFPLRLNQMCYNRMMHTPSPITIAITNSNTCNNSCTYGNKLTQASHRTSSN